jgi:hypothetical protein
MYIPTAADVRTEGKLKVAEIEREMFSKLEACKDLRQNAETGTKIVKDAYFQILEYERIQSTWMSAIWDLVDFARRTTWTPEIDAEIERLFAEKTELQNRIIPSAPTPYGRRFPTSPAPAESSGPSASPADAALHAVGGGLAAIGAALARPKSVVRNADGKIVGVE